MPKGARILSVEPANDGSYVRFPDGRVMGDVNVVSDEETVEKIRSGYMCIRCYEPQQEAFPEVCQQKLPGTDILSCNFPIREQQAEEFARLYDPQTVHVGSRINPADELERVIEKDRYEQRTGIRLPPGAGL